jgi:hypothetical protein
MILNRYIVEELFAKCNHRVLYGYGDKPALDADSSTISRADCSGFTRWVVYRASGVTIPEGSVEQHAWAQANLKSVPFVEARNDQTNRMFQCFIVPSDVNDNIGHTYFLQNGSSFECCGGEQYSPIYDKDVDGVMSRVIADTPVLLNETSVSFEWPSIAA